MRRTPASSSTRASPICRWLATPSTYVAVANDGGEDRRAARSLIPPRALAIWRPLLERHRTRPRPFYLLHDDVRHRHSAAARKLDTVIAPYVSRTMKIGISRAHPLHAHDARRGRRLAFDPDFDPTRKCGERPVADDNLNAVIALRGQDADAGLVHPQRRHLGRLRAATSRMGRQRPARGGPRATASGTRSNQVYPDDYLKDLPGSHESPELARSLTFNVYARKVRALQEAQPAGGGPRHRGVRARASGPASSASRSTPTPT